MVVINSVSGRLQIDMPAGVRGDFPEEAGKRSEYMSGDGWRSKVQNGKLLS